MANANAAPSALLLVAVSGERVAELRQMLNLVLPRAAIATLDGAAAAEGSVPTADVALVDAGARTRDAVDAVRVLRARDFRGPIVIITAAPDDEALTATAQSLGARCISSSVATADPAALAAEVIAALGEDVAASREVAYARRVFAAGQATLSLQHAINNPLAGLLAEAQILQLEELTKEQRDSVERIIELCRRVVALVRRLDALGAG